MARINLPLLLTAVATMICPSAADFDLLLLHINDMHARFEQADVYGSTCTDDLAAEHQCYGGFPRVKTAVQEARAEASKENISSIFLNAGDNFQGTAYYSLLKWKVVAALLPYLGTDVMLLHSVKKISIHEQRWNVVVNNLKERKEETYCFDAVLICNGHYSCPYIPYVKGLEEFLSTGGYHTHSHFYRHSEMYKGIKVLVVGCGPSGTDIACELMCVAEKIIVSTRRYDPTKPSPFPKGVIMKPGIDHFSKKTVHFTDGSQEEIDLIMYGTGYLYRYPFLEENCNIRVCQNRFVHPLYKQMININEPTMGFIGLIIGTFLFPTFDLQARVYLSLLLTKMPSKEEMLQSWLMDLKNQEAKKKAVHDYHTINVDEGEVAAVCEDLAKIGGIEKLPPVYTKMFKVVHNFASHDYGKLRKYYYRVIDNETFEIFNADDPLKKSVRYK